MKQGWMSSLLIASTVMLASLAFPSSGMAEQLEQELETSDGVILRSTLPEQRNEWQGEKIDLSLKDADLRSTLLSFAEIGDFNLILDDSVQGTVTVELRGVPWDQALVAILKTHGLGLEISGSKVEIYRIAPH
ncbi:MAG: secretin and TonB N-terminal domain-containing protein [Acidobacteriota bacterium]